MKINSKWIKDLKIKPETLNQLQEVAGNTLEYIGIGNDFLNRTLMGQQLRQRLKKWDCIKLKSFFTEKETVTKLKRIPTQNAKLPKHEWPQSDTAAIW
jgi:hypothetical protein